MRKNMNEKGTARFSFFASSVVGKLVVESSLDLSAERPAEQELGMTDDR
jgi:hypothetical protein